MGSHQLLQSICAFNQAKLDKFPAERRLAALRGEAIATLVGAHQQVNAHGLAAGLVIGADLENSTCVLARTWTAIITAAQQLADQQRNS